MKDNIHWIIKPIVGHIDIKISLELVILSF